MTASKQNGDHLLFSILYAILFTLCVYMSSKCIIYTRRAIASLSTESISLRLYTIGFFLYQSN